MSEFREEPSKEALSPMDRLMRMRSKENLEILGKNLLDAGKMETAVKRLEALTEQDTSPEHQERNKGYQDMLERLINQANAGNLAIVQVETWQQAVGNAYEKMKRRQNKEQFEKIADLSEKLTMMRILFHIDSDEGNLVESLEHQRDDLRKAAESSTLDPAKLERWKQVVDRLYEQYLVRQK